MRKWMLMLALVTASVTAAPVYKCDSSGPTAYNDQSCPGGTEVKIYQPTEADKASAQARSDAEKKAEKKLAHQRLKREVAEDRERQKAARRAAIKQKKCANLELKAKWAEEDARRATGKKLDKAQRKAHRATEKFVLECRQ